MRASEKKQQNIDLDEHLSDLAKLFYRANTEGIENMYDEPQHLGDSFTQAVKEIMDKRREDMHNEQEG